MVELADGHNIIAYMCGKMHEHRIRFLAVDKVSAEMARYDLTEERITFGRKDERVSVFLGNRPLSFGRR